MYPSPRMTKSRKNKKVADYSPGISSRFGSVSPSPSNYKAKHSVMFG